ncbi:MAG: hypothetical protein HY022_08500 [Chloroflexi bacterium]|nr:hypothetical protein [Chloroflexota bacterium]
MNEKKRQLLNDFPWEETYPKLVAFAEWVIQGKNWNSGVLPKGQTAETIVQDVIAKTFSEKRNWDPERGDLLDWLKWVIRSEISHLAESSANKRDIHLDHLNDNDPAVARMEDMVNRESRVRPQANSPEEAMIAVETEDELMASAGLRIDSLLEACSGKPELEEIVYAICYGKCSAKPQDLSKCLGRPIKEINQHLRALRRRASKIRIEAENGRE